MLGLITFALFIGVIWLEIIVFGLVGDAIGVLLTIIGVFVTAAIGIRLFRASGRATMARMQESVKAGRPPCFRCCRWHGDFICGIFVVNPRLCH